MRHATRNPTLFLYSIQMPNISFDITDFVPTRRNYYVINHRYLKQPLLDVYSPYITWLVAPTYCKGMLNTVYFDGVSQIFVI